MMCHDNQGEGGRRGGGGEEEGGDGEQAETPLPLSGFKSYSCYSVTKNVDGHISKLILFGIHPSRNVKELPEFYF